jgi:rubrerythrin
MKAFKSVDELLAFAIKEEEGAAAFYKALGQPAMKAMFEEFSREEEGHKQKLQKIKSGEQKSLPQQKILDLKIGDYLVEAEPSDDMDYQQALVLAMQKEKAAFRMYTDLATAAQDPQVRQILQGLAQEEAKHKLRFEVEYDEHVLQEN